MPPGTARTRSEARWPPAEDKADHPKKLFSITENGSNTGRHTFSLNIFDANLQASAMRTTVNLDNDGLERLQKESKRSDADFRRGLVAVEQTQENHQPLVVIPRSIGLKTGFNFDSISLLLALAEGEDHR